jgi:hypothetical protein
MACWLVCLLSSGWTPPLKRLATVVSLSSLMDSQKVYQSVPPAAGLGWWPRLRRGANSFRLPWESRFQHDRQMQNSSVRHFTKLSKVVGHACGVGRIHFAWRGSHTFSVTANYQKPQRDFFEFIKFAEQDSERTGVELRCFPPPIRITAGSFPPSYGGFRLPPACPLVHP